MIIPQEYSSWSSESIVDIFSPKKSPLTRDGWSSLIGIITAIVGNILISIALNTQRYAHIRLNAQWQIKRKLLKKAERRQQALSKNISNGNGATSTNEHEPLLASYRSGSDEGEEDPDQKPSEPPQKSYLTSPYWWIGIILMTLGEAGNFLAYGFAPASTVSPLGVVAIISNCIIAPFFMKEKFRWRDFFGVVIAVGGAVTVVLSASEKNPKLGPNEIWKLISRWEFETYLGVTIGLIVCLMLVSNKYGHKSILIDLGLVGLFGGYTALSTKGVASLLSYTLFKALTFPVTYLLVLVLAFTAVMQIKYVNRALQRFESTQVIPTQFVMFTLSVIVGSAILYRDFERTSGDKAGKFVGGCAMTFIGVWFITSGRESSSNDDDEFIDEDDEAIILRHGETYQDDAHVAPSYSSTRRSTINSPTSEYTQQELFTQGDESSQVSLPGSLQHNHWESMSESASTPTERPSISVLSPSHTENDIPDQIYDGSIWGKDSQTQVESQRSVSRFLRPLSSLFSTNSTNLHHQNIPNSTSSINSGLNSSLDAHRRSINTLQPPFDPSHYGSSLPNAKTTNSPYLHNEHATPRHSLSSLYLGPYTSPLSSSLSVVVQDSIRRRGARGKRRRSSLLRPSGLSNGVDSVVTPVTPVTPISSRKNSARIPSSTITTDTETPRQTLLGSNEEFNPFTTDYQHDITVRRSGASVVKKIGRLFSNARGKKKANQEDAEIEDDSLQRSHERQMRDDDEIV